MFTDLIAIQKYKNMQAFVKIKACCIQIQFLPNAIGLQLPENFVALREKLNQA